MRLLAGLAVLAGCAYAQPFPACDGDDEAYLMVKVLSASHLKCSDTFGRPDPFAEVSQKHGNFTITKITKTIDNTNNPTWDAVLDFGCLPVDTPVTLLVKDYDYFTDEVCAGPITLSAWPASAVTEEACDSSEPAKGCISYEFLYTLHSTPSRTSPSSPPKKPSPPTFPFPSGPRNTTIPSGASRNGTASKRPPVPPVTTPTQQQHNASQGPVSYPPAWAKKNDTRAPVPPPPVEEPKLHPVDPVLEQPNDSTKEGHDGHGHQSKRGKAGVIAGSILGTLMVVSALVAAVVVFRRRPARSPLNLDETGREGAHVANLHASPEDGPASV